MLQLLKKQKEQFHKELLEMPDEEAVENQGSASSTGGKATTTLNSVECKGEVEVNLVCENKFRGNLVCRSKHGVFTEIMEATSNLGLEVTNANFLTHNGVSRIMFCVEVRGNQVVSTGEVTALMLNMIC